MLASVVCAVLCGARGVSAVVQWLHLQPVSTWHRLGFRRTPPKETCFTQLLARLPPEDFEGPLAAWLREGLGLGPDEPPAADGELRPLSVDGKTLCGTLSAHGRALHLLSALDHELGCVLAQCAVDAKTNEAKAVLGLLDRLPLAGRVVLGDAIFCQREVCEKARDRGGHYFFVVKENQPTLLREVEAAFVETAAFSPLRPAGVRGRA
jgi:hypothetical protein